MYLPASCRCAIDAMPILEAAQPFDGEQVQRVELAARFGVGLAPIHVVRHIDDEASVPARCTLPHFQRIHQRNARLRMQFSQPPCQRHAGNAGAHHGVMKMMMAVQPLADGRVTGRRCFEPAELAVDGGKFG